MMKKVFFSVIIIISVCRAGALAASVSGTVEKGNRLYRGARYEEALKCYDQALAKQPDSAIVNFDSGTAQYKTKEYKSANSSFEKSLLTEDKVLEAKANYNLGNSKYMLGLSKEKTDLSLAVQLLEGALNNYQRTQELVPKDQDVKINYKIVQEKLKELKEKLKQQPQENKSNQQQEQQSQQQAPNEQEESGQQSASAQNKQQQSGQESQKEKEGQEKQDQSALASESSMQQKESKSASAGAQEPKEMSKEEATMLLEGYRQEENAAGMLKDDQKGTEDKVLKDW